MERLPNNPYEQVRKAGNFVLRCLFRLGTVVAGLTENALNEAELRQFAYDELAKQRGIDEEVKRHPAPDTIPDWL